MPGKTCAWKPSAASAEGCVCVHESSSGKMGIG